MYPGEKLVVGLRGRPGESLECLHDNQGTHPEPPSDPPPEPGSTQEGRRGGVRGRRTITLLCVRNNPESSPICLGVGRAGLGEVSGSVSTDVLRIPGEGSLRVSDVETTGVENRPRRTGPTGSQKTTLSTTHLHSSVDPDPSIYW